MKRFCKSFCYAAKGIASCLATQRNMRVHFCAAFYVLVLMRFYDLSAAQRTVIYLTIGLVIAFEALNTAIEAAIDLITEEKKPLAGLSKDAAAGATLVMAVTAVAVGITLFWDTKAFSEIYEFFCNNILALAMLAVSAVVWIIIICLPLKDTKDCNKINKKDIEKEN